MNLSKCAMLVLLALVCGVLVTHTPAGGQGKDDQYVKVDIKGTLKTGIMAIGGETTGTVVTAGTMSFELDFGKNKEWRELADKLNGKTVIVHGNLTMRKGVEVKQRTIVTVTSFKAAE